MGLTDSAVTICIPSLPVRREMLGRALISVAEQTHPRVSVSLAYDQDPRDGAWTTRNRAAAKAVTEWIGFLDDDDELLPFHVKFLLHRAEEVDADMVWGWFDVVGGTDPFPHYRGRQYDPGQPHIVPITYLIKRDLFMDSGGFKPDESNHGSWEVQDMGILQAVATAGGKMYASSITTWKWHHHMWNTSGLPSRHAG